jgi:hypothetical protein
MADPIDLRFQSNAPMAAIIQAYQNKAEMQEKMKMDQNAIENQNINRIAGVFQGAASLTSGLVQQAEQRQRMAALMTQVDKGGISVPVAQPTGPNASVEPSAPFADTEGQAPQQPPQMQLLKDTPEWQSRTRELALSAFPKETGTALAKSLFENPNGAAASFHNKGVPLNMINKLTGDVVAANYNPITNQYVKTSSGEVLGSEWIKQYAPSAQGNSFGGVSLFQKTPGVAPVPYNQTPPGDADGGSPADAPDSALVDLQAKAPKLADRYIEARDQALPAKNPRIAAAIDSAQSAVAVKSILTNPNPSQVGLASLGFHLARLSGSNSQLSDTERTTFEQPLAFLDKLKNKGYRFVAGDLSPQMKSDLTRLSTLLEKKSRLQVQKQLNTAKQSARLAAGPFWNKGLDAGIPTVDDLVASAKEVNDDGGAAQGGSAEDQANQFLTGLLGGPK